MLPRAILAAFDDNFGRQRPAQVDVHYVKSRTEERTGEMYVSARNLSACGLFTRGPLGDAEGRRTPFHLFHLPDSRTDGSNRIRKRHLIRRRGHFTFCPPVCPSVRPSRPCVASLFPRSRFLHRRPTNRATSGHRHRVSIMQRVQRSLDDERIDEIFFSPDIPRPQSALQLELADEWYLRGKKKLVDRKIRGWA